MSISHHMEFCLWTILSELTGHLGMANMMDCRITTLGTHLRGKEIFILTLHIFRLCRIFTKNILSFKKGQYPDQPTLANIFRAEDRTVVLSHYSFYYLFFLFFIFVSLFVYFSYFIPHICWARWDYVAAL